MIFFWGGIKDSQSGDGNMQNRYLHANGCISFLRTACRVCFIISKWVLQWHPYFKNAYIPKTTLWPCIASGDNICKYKEYISVNVQRDFTVCLLLFWNAEGQQVYPWIWFKPWLLESETRAGGKKEGWIKLAHLMSWYCLVLEEKSFIHSVNKFFLMLWRR